MAKHILGCSAGAAWLLSSSRVSPQSVCTQRSQQADGQQGMGSHFTRILGKLNCICVRLNQRVKDKDI